MTTSATGGYLVPTNTPALSDLDFARKMNHLVSGVTGITGSLVRPRWQPAQPTIPTVDTDWIAIGVTTIDLLNGGGVSSEERHFSEGDGYSVLIEHEEFLMLASCYGPACERTARRIRAGLQINQNWEELHSFGVSGVAFGAIRFLPELVNEQWYHRADVEITMRRQVDSRFDILNFLSASGYMRTGNLNGLDENWAVTGA